MFIFGIGGALGKRHSRKTQLKLHVSSLQPRAHLVMFCFPVGLANFFSGLFTQGLCTRRFRLTHHSFPHTLRCRVPGITFVSVILRTATGAEAHDPEIRREHDTSLK